MFLTCVDYFMCLGITISRIGIGAIVAILTLKHLGPVEPKLSWCYTRLQGNLQANLCLRVGGNTKLSTSSPAAENWMLQLGHSATTKLLVFDKPSVGFYKSQAVTAALGRTQFLPCSLISFTPYIILYLLFNSGISFSATALLLSYYSCVGIIVECALQ